jgi:transcriptional regulator with XRE-family HTH domain
MNKEDEYKSKFIGEIMEEISPDYLEKTRKRMLVASIIDNGIKAKGWRKTDLAKALKKRPSEITKWLSGTHNFNMDTLMDIEQILGIRLINVEMPVKPKTVRYSIEVSEKVINPYWLKRNIFIPWTSFLVVGGNDNSNSAFALCNTNKFEQQV